MPTIDREALETTMRAELRAAWATLRGRHPGERFYSFGLYTTDLAEYLSVTASTEEGLSEVTQRYVTETGGDPGAQRLALRWSPCDSPLHGEGEALLAETLRIRCAGPDPCDDTPEADDANALIFDIAIQALRQLDADGRLRPGAGARAAGAGDLEGRPIRRGAHRVREPAQPARRRRALRARDRRLEPRLRRHGRRPGVALLPEMADRRSHTATFAICTPSAASTIARSIASCSSSCARRLLACSDDIDAAARARARRGRGHDGVAALPISAGSPARGTR